MKLNAPARYLGLARDLRNDELPAYLWGRHNHPRDFRKQFCDTFAHHMERRPGGIREECWAWWYFFPFGVSSWNQHVFTLRCLFNEANGTLSDMAAALAKLPLDDA